MNYQKILKYPLATEKAVKLIESDNKITFIVNKKSTKKEIKKELEQVYKVKVINVRTVITNKGEKKAYILLSQETPAIDIATKLGLI